MLRRPVVSVGNLAMGGRGKTPVVAHLTRTLLSADFRPAILSRGYGRRHPVDGVVIVSDGTHLRADLDRSGDEPLMLARSLPGAIVVVSPNRALAGTLAERVLGADVHILDDGFQHRQVSRDVDLVIVAPEDLIGRRFPFGPLRESARALRRADAVIVDGSAAADGNDTRERIRAHTAARIFIIERRLRGPAPIEPDRGEFPQARRVVAVAGIAAPARFGRALVEAGWDLARLMAFRDHHRYDARDIARIVEVMRQTGAEAVLTTEKDAVRMLPLRPFPIPIAAVPLAIEISPADGFEQWLLDRLRECRH